MPYDPTFIPGFQIPLPELSDAVRESAFNGGQPIEHTKFSIVFNERRGFASVTAHNVDGLNQIEAGRIDRRSFIFDPDAPRAIQVDNDQGYRNNRWDRGHLVRRRSLHWGDFDEAVAADRESSFWTNIAPQHELLHDTAWGSIEDFILELAENSDLRMAVFQAPVLTSGDPSHVNRPREEPIQIPAGFWKIVVITHQGELRAAAFLVWQRDFDKAVPETFDPVLEQVRVTTIEFLTGVSFPQVLRDADPLHFSEDRDTRLARDASARGLSVPIRRGAPPQSRPSFVRGPGDIRL